MAFCPGCGKEFSVSGCAKHLAQTTNPSCRQIYNALYKFDASESNISEDGRDRSPSLFSEDFFDTENQYRADDFDYWNANDDKMMVDDGHGDGHGDWHEHGDGHGDGDGHAYEYGDGNGNGDGNESRDDVAVDDDDDDEFDFLEHYFGNGWEPDITSQGSVNEPDELEDDLDLENDGSEPLPAKFIAGMQLCSEPVVVKFPNPNAGASIGTDGNSGYHDYQTKVKNSGSSWAPFKSKMEWEIARWAKIRGPGSTAFDELMQIQGVSYNNVYAIFT
jgi:hypothetical protein